MYVRYFQSSKRVCISGDRCFFLMAVDKIADLTVWAALVWFAKKKNYSLCASFCFVIDSSSTRLGFISSPHLKLCIICKLAVRFFFLHNLHMIKLSTSVYYERTWIFWLVFHHIVSTKSKQKEKKKRYVSARLMMMFACSTVFITA